MEYIDIYDDFGRKHSMPVKKTRPTRERCFIKVFAYGLLILKMKYYFKPAVIRLCFLVC